MEFFGGQAKIWGGQCLLAGGHLQKKDCRYGTLLFQARRQSSLTGGTKKIFRGHIQSFPQIRKWRRNIKTVFISNYASWIWAVSFLSEHSSRSGKGGGGTFITWQDETDSYGADITSCPQFQG